MRRSSTARYRCCRDARLPVPVLCRAGVVLQVIVALCCWSSGTAWSQSSVAVLGFEEDGHPVPEGVVEEVAAALGERGPRWVMPVQEAVAVLSAGQLLSADVGSREVVRDIQRGIDLFYEGELSAAQELLEPALDRALGKPMLLAIDSSLSEAARQGLMIVPRIYLATADFDAAAATTRRVIEAFPFWTPSRKAHAPDVIELVEASRAQLTSTSRRLKLRQAAAGEACQVNLNGLSTAVEGEVDLAVAPADYGLLLSCSGGAEHGPWLVNLSRAEVVLPISRALLAALSPTQTGKSLVLPESLEQRRDLGVLLTTLLGVEAVVLVGSTPGGGGVLAIEVSRGGSVVQARLDSALQQEGVRDLVRALADEQPYGAVGVDTSGRGFVYAESPSYAVEYVMLGVGGVGLITGITLWGLAGAQHDVVRECRVPGACRRATSQENNDLLATDLFVGQLMVGISSAVLVGATTSLLLRMLWLEHEEGLDALARQDGLSVGLQPGGGAMATWRLTW